MTKEEAIKIFQHKIETMERGAICCDYGIDKDAFALAIQVLKQDQKTGHWIEDENEMEVWCSKCGEENDDCSKYCPNCGAKMESEVEK